jgi:tetratricopeptide (TPR) repeat protein
MHSAACQVDALLRIGEFSNAERIAASALQSEPRNPDLIAAHGLVLAYTWREEAAIEVLGKATLSPLGRRLAQVLAAHLISRQRLSAKSGVRDLFAHAFLTKVRMQTNQPIDKVGVELSAWVDARRPGDLERCLTSLASGVDEIVVYAPNADADLVSTLRKFGARIASTNDPVSECSFDWILRLDPNEELISGGAEKIRTLVVRPHFSGFEWEIGGEWSLRLVRREQGLQGYPVGRYEEPMFNRFGNERSEGALESAESPIEALSRCDLADEMGMGNAQNEYERALALSQIGEIEEGLAASARCLSFDWPGDITPEHASDRYCLRGKLLVSKGDFDAAAEMFELAVQSNPDCSEAKLEWAKAWERMGKFDAALAVYLSGQESPEIGVECLSGAGRACSRLGLAKRSADLFREAWRRNPVDASAWMAWVEAAIAYGEPEGIVEAYEATGTSPTLPACGFAAWGEAHHALGNLSQAAEKLRLAIAQPDVTPEMHFLLAETCERLSLDTEAAQVYESGLSLAPDRSDAWMALGRILNRLGLLHGAKISCHRVLSIDPGCNEARQLLDRICQAA